MDDYTNENLLESRNEWVSRLINILLPHLVEGINSIFKESYEMCISNNERDKYLMTFQNFLSRIPSWNQTIIDQECQRIITNSKCNYINDLLTCVHVIMLKSLTNVRVCKNQKKIDIDIPKFEGFVHNVYIQIARKLYKNIYLYEYDCSPLQKQKNSRECEIIIRECILGTIRDTIPVDTILRAYMSENMEEEVDVPVNAQKEADVVDSSSNVPTAPGTASPVPASHEPASHEPASHDSTSNVTFSHEPAAPEPALPVPASHEPAAHESAAHEPAAPEPAVPVLPAHVPPLQLSTLQESTSNPSSNSSSNLLNEMNTIIEPVELNFDTLDTDYGGSIKINGDNDDNLLSLDDITEL